MPHINKLLNDEQNKEVIEKTLECIRDLADEMGPGAFTEGDLMCIVMALKSLLDKTSFCQTGEGADIEEDDDDSE